MNKAIRNSKISLNRNKKFIKMKYYNYKNNQKNKIIKQKTLRNKNKNQN